MESQFRYEQLANMLRDRISQLPTGTRLPSVRSLIKRHAVSLPTVQAALALLEKENLLITKKRSGTFVSDKRSIKFIILHRTRSPSVVSDEVEISLLRSIAAEGWQLYSKRHILEGDTFKPADAHDVSDLRACAHILTDEIASFQYGLLPELLNQKVPTVVIGRDTGQIGVDCVSGDERQIMFSLIKHLRSLGHQKFGLLVNEPMCFRMAPKRIDLFRSALSVFDLPEGQVIDCQTQPGERSSVLAYEGLQKFLAQSKKKLPFTALLVASGAGGPGGLRALHEAGFRVPQDCSVATIGLGQNSGLLIPSLSEAGDPPGAVGETVVKVLKMRFAGDDTESLSLNAPIALYVRESIGPAPMPKNRARKPVASRTESVVA